MTCCVSPPETGKGKGVKRKREEHGAAPDRRDRTQNRACSGGRLLREGTGVEKRGKALGSKSGGFWGAPGRRTPATGVHEPGREGGAVEGRGEAWPLAASGWRSPVIPHPTILDWRPPLAPDLIKPSGAAPHPHFGGGSRTAPDLCERERESAREGGGEGAAGRAMEYYPAPGRNHLFVPGPTNVAEPVLRAMNRSNEDHRSPAFPKLSKSVIDDVKQIFRTTAATSFVFPTTGTGAWESALTNTLSPGDKIISFRLGQFSLLWIDQMQRYNFDVDVVECEWGAGADLDILRQKLEADASHSVKAVCVVHNETSTGVTNDIGAVRKVLDAARHPALLLVDGVSSIGAIDFRMDEWNVDVALTGSQKALSLPTGLGIVCASPKALEAAKKSTSTRVFFDWGDYLKFYKAGSYWPYTPSSQMLYGLRASLDMILKEEGLDNVIARHCRLAEATRQAVKAWGLTLCTKDPKWKSDTVTAVVVPSWLNSDNIVKIAYKKYNLSLGVGLNKIAGKVFRIGHLGNVNELQLLGALAGVELCLREVGYPVTLGSGVAAAQAHLAKKTPLIASRI